MDVSVSPLPLFLRGPLSLLLLLVSMAASLGRSSTPLVLTPQATGERTAKNQWAQVDFSNADLGYVMVRYTGPAHKIRMQLIHEGGEPYTYDLATDGRFETFPLSDGDGAYALNIYRNLRGEEYIFVFGAAFEAVIDDELSPFLHPNQYVHFTAQSEAVAFTQTLCAGAADDLEAVGRIYDYVIGNIGYDYAKAQTVTSGYLPDIDEVLREKKGICFDYASLMTAMLRSQRIPSKLVVGYAGAAYHAWISVYTEQTGWVDGYIHFDGTSWVRMDPTYAAAYDRPRMRDLIGDGTNYNALFFY